MIKRQITAVIQRLSAQYPVVTLMGPRQSGKTTLCQAVFPTHEYSNLEDLETRRYAIEDPKGFLSQFSGGVILDEIQRAPDLASYIQVISDQKKENGRFVLTGSQQFEITQSVSQSLAGRTAICKLLPLSLTEAYGDSVPDYEQVLFKGFYPRVFDQNLDPTEAMSFYLSTYVERDIRSLINIRNLTAFERFLKICATQIGQLVNYTTIANDVGIDQKTVKEWLSLLEASYIIFQVQPHFKNFRKRVTKSSKLYFYDVGLACYLLGISQVTHVETHPLKGVLFENLIVSEYLKNRFNQARDSNLYFYRDQTGNEVDMVIDQGGTLQAIEIKSSRTLKSEHFKGLNFYKDICGEFYGGSCCVYGGDKNMVWNEVNVHSYKYLNQLFSSLN